MTLLGWLFVVWVFLTALVLVVPSIYIGQYLYIACQKVYKYTVDHAKDMKAIANFSSGGFFHVLKEKQVESESIFPDKVPVKNIEQEVVTDEVQSNDLQKPQNNQGITKQEKNKLKQKTASIKAEALVAKNKGNFDLYEKLLIEGMSLDVSVNQTFKKMLIDRYFSTKNFKKALTLLKQVLTNEPKNHKALRQVGEIHLEKGEFDIAEMLVKKAIELSPKSPKYYVTMVEILFNVQRLDEAIGLMQKVVKLRPSNVRYILGLASLYEKTEEYTEAKACYLQVIHLDPTNDKARKKLKQL